MALIRNDDLPAFARQAMLHTPSNAQGEIMHDNPHFSHEAVFDATLI